MQLKWEVGTGKLGTKERRAAGVKESRGRGLGFRGAVGGDTEQQDSVTDGWMATRGPQGQWSWWGCVPGLQDGQRKKHLAQNWTQQAREGGNLQVHQDDHLSWSGLGTLHAQVTSRRCSRYRGKSRWTLGLRSKWKHYLQVECSEPGGGHWRQSPAN